MARSFNRKNKTFAIPPKNYIYIFIGIVLIVIGYILMTGGASNDPNIFSYEIFSFRRIVLSPIIILLGFIIEIFAIMHKPKK